MNLALGWLLAYWLFTPPRYQIGLQGVEDEVGMYLYLFVGIGLAIIGGMLHRLRRELSDALRELARQNEVLEEKVRAQTEQLKQSFDQLRDAERMSMMGMLTAGLGHDLGNLLFVCQARLDAIARLEQTPELVEHVESIRQAMNYIRTLTSTLRQLAIDPERMRHEAHTSPAAWVSEVKPLLKAALPRQVRLEFDVPALPEVKIDPARLSQIVFNLAHNAGDALADSPQGVVRIAAHLDHAGDAVMFEVTDNGPGMSEEVRQHCLEPSFTTKKHGHGTGMGLALVNHLVRQASGTLAIQSEQGRGTTFTIRLPIEARPQTIAP
jgi:signal transduction histidine kinase